jgi:hypothetical protein
MISFGQGEEKRKEEYMLSLPVTSIYTCSELTLTVRPSRTTPCSTRSKLQVWALDGVERGSDLVEDEQGEYAVLFKPVSQGDRKLRRP